MSEPAPIGAPKGKPARPLMLLLGCAGCGFLLLLAGVGITMGYLLWQQGRGAGRDRPPVAWRDSLRASFRLPAEVARLALPQADSGDATALLAAAAVMDGGTATRRARAARRVRDGAGYTAEDSALIRAAPGDSLAAFAAQAARRGRFDPLAQMRRAPRLMAPLGEGLWSGAPSIGRAVDGLALRGEARRWRGDLKGARQDFAAVVALGRMSWTNDMNALGPGIGRRAMYTGAAGLARVAAATRDTALAADAATVRDWAARDRASLYRFRLSPDSLMLAAQDTALPPGVRAAALEMACYGALFRPATRLITGPSRFVLDGAATLARDTDPVMAWAGKMADSTLRRLDAMGIRNRYRLAAGKPLR